MAEDTQKTAEETEVKTEGNDIAETPAEETAEETVTTVTEEVKKDDLDMLKPGQVIRVHLKIKETTPKGDERERIQVFEGTIIAKKGRERNSATITVRKVSKGYGVERIFPLRMPAIAKIELVKELKTRRAKLYYTRTSKRKLKETAPKGTVQKKTARKAPKRK
ncbi:50S ribosomal protein L19 [Candidatus Uhrbacteria bacterium]|nr:50S ribosomal protein L19 [Candidatus Uhrbacteria bacterium]